MLIFLENKHVFINWDYHHSYPVGRKSEIHRGVDISNLIVDYLEKKNQIQIIPLPNENNNSDQYILHLSIKMCTAKKKWKGKKKDQTMPGLEQCLTCNKCYAM